MRYYAYFMFVVIVAVIIRMYYQQELLVFGIGGTAVSIALANMVAYVKLHRRIAEIFFHGDSFSVISIYDILHEQPKKAFPLKFANPTRTQDEIQFHFTDQIFVLRREDWSEEFELIWNWLNQRGQPDIVFHYQG